MLDGKPLQITFRDEYVIFRTLDHQDFPVEIWRLKKDELTDVQRIFISNILSMSTSMISELEKKKNEENYTSGD